ncbi:exonuclease domain-containing protein [Vacuolonema iberomarrocanum]|uniref:exonuclease domain-containing protein n=1 Tax=Vacuolonema iberomarrocanum TaxID=3454632 RepID=UPI001A034F51|nr:exonuclease domain-containing protein [filamentous cyanobacterium LEGE 07170]
MNIGLFRYDYYLIVDLEATCCDKFSIPHKETETIEIGAVIVEAVGLEVIDEFTVFVKPIRHPKLTAFCTELTTIKQADLENAPTFPQAVETFKCWFEQYKNSIFCSWGDYDKTQLKRDAKYHKIPYPMGNEHLNLKQQFSLASKTRKHYGMARALETVGLALDGTHHRGIDDARNLAKLMPFIIGRKRIS